MKILTFVNFFLLAIIVNADELPKNELTPGAINPEVTQQNIDSTICIKGWTKTIRPPNSYTRKLKVRQIEAYGYANVDLKEYEEDHLISLELGGSPRDPKNLWPEPWNGDWGAHKKDALENKLHHLVCNHELALVDAQKAIANDWIKAYHQYVEKQ